MGILNIFKKPFRDVHDAINSYERFHNKIVSTLEEYETSTKIKNEKTESILINGIKETYLYLKDSGLDLDNIVLGHIKNGEGKKLSQFANKMQKHSIVPLSVELIEAADVEIVEFPEMISKDVINYADKMLAYYKDLKETKIKIKDLNKLIASGVEKELNIEILNRMLELNKQNEILFKHAFAKEALITNRLLEKNLCFISLPVDINEDTIRIHAYFRKLVDFKVINVENVFKKYTNYIPEIILPYEEELGYYVLDQENILEKNKKSA